MRSQAHYSRVNNLPASASDGRVRTFRLWRPPPGLPPFADGPHEAPDLRGFGVLGAAKGANEPIRGRALGGTERASGVVARVNYSRVNNFHYRGGAMPPEP